MVREQRGELPDPDDRPTGDVVIYDGACRLCRGSVRWLDRLDRRGRLAFLPFQDRRVAERYPDLSPEALKQHVYVVDGQGRRRKGAGAVRYLARRIPALWALVPLLHVPGSMPVWRWLYYQVARRRHMIDGPE